MSKSMPKPKPTLSNQDTTQDAQQSASTMAFNNGRWFTDFLPFSGRLEQDNVGINEYLPISQSVLMAVQHAFAMFGATVLAPLLMGFDANLAILLSGVSTILFFVITGGRMPSYLGSSFAFIGPVLAVTAYAGSGLNPNLSVALGGIMACGILYALIGLVVMKIGTSWIERLMPPVVTGAIVMIIGLNLAGVTVSGVSGNEFDKWMAVMTVLVIALVAVFAKGMFKRLLLLLGLLLAYVLYWVVTAVMGLGTPMNFTEVAAADWVGLPTFYAPSFDANAIIMLAPVAFILIAENLGHFKAVEAMTQLKVTPFIGRGFVADGLATTLSAGLGGTGVTTYAENIGVMAVTKVYSTIVFVLAGVVAILLGLSPKFGAVIHTIPTALLGGASMVVFGLISVAGVRIWQDNQVDFSDNRNLLIAAITVIMGTGNFSLTLGGFDLGGIGTATLVAILLNVLFYQKQA